MRILGWMHRKLRQNNADPLKDFNIGRASLDECKPQFTRAGSIQKDHYALYLKPFPGLGLDDGINNNKEEEEESLSDIFTHLHHGLLAIGTLGADPVEPIPALEKETGHEAPHGQDATGHLEKVAEEEANADAQSGGCHVDAKPVGPALAEPAAHQTNLQVDAGGHQAEYSDKAPAAKKEHRVSLGELFSKTKTADDGEHADGKAGRADGAKAVHLVKKILKRKTGTGKNSGPNEAVGAENKIHKLFHMFNRKVHPSECCPTTVKKCGKEDMKHMKDSDVLDDKDTFIHVDPVTGKGKIRQYKGQPNPPDFALCGSDSNGNREYWIKTDAECFAFHRFLVDGIPLRRIPRSKALGLEHPARPMSLYASIWVASDWATDGGEYRANYEYEPFRSAYANFNLYGCGGRNCSDEFLESLMPSKPKQEFIRSLNFVRKK